MVLSEGKAGNAKESCCIRDGFTFEKIRVTRMADSYRNRQDEKRTGEK